MTYSIYVNVAKAIEWDLSKTTCFVMDAFANLESWAVKYKSNDEESDEVYYLLYRSKILADLPFLGSLSSISRSIQELEKKKIIKSMNKSSHPVYCLTEKGKEWKDKASLIEKKNDSTQKVKTKSTFSLVKKSRFDDTSDEYKNMVYTYCVAYCVECKIEKSLFQEFIDWHISKGNEYVNWVSAFRSWVRKSKKLKEPVDRGLYK